MKITTAERIAINVTIALLLFTAGFFFGRTTVTGSVVVEAATPETSAYIQPSAVISAETSPEPSTEDSCGQYVSADKEESAEHSAADAESTLWMPDSGELLDLNLATQEELENLPEIGPVLAQRIIEYRSSIGRFQSLEELKNVDGIGDKTYSEISEYLKVDDNNENSGS